MLLLFTIEASPNTHLAHNRTTARTLCYKIFLSVVRKKYSTSASILVYYSNEIKNWRFPMAGIISVNALTQYVSPQRFLRTLLWITAKVERIFGKGGINAQKNRIPGRKSPCPEEFYPASKPVFAALTALTKQNSCPPIA